MAVIASRRVGLFLLLSLMTNLFLGGLVLGGWWQKQAEENAPPATRLPGLREITRLVPEKSEELSALFRTHRADMLDQARALRRAHRRVRALLAREPLDEAALEQALAETRRLREALHGQAHQVLIEVARELTPAQRQRLARARAHRGPPGHLPPRVKWEQLDKNQDGALAREEFIQGWPPGRQHRARRRFERLDRDQNGLLEKAELP